MEACGLGVAAAAAGRGLAGRAAAPRSESNAGGLEGGPEATSAIMGRAAASSDAVGMAKPRVRLQEVDPGGLQGCNAHEDGSDGAVPGQSRSLEAMAARMAPQRP